MKCYRRLSPIKAISFDLDDTLYDNQPILDRAEQAQLAFLHQQLPQTRRSTVEDWQAFKLKLLAEQPQLRHNIGELRTQAIYHQLLSFQLPAAQARTMAQQAFEVFYRQRIKISISAEVMVVLQQLAQHYPLIAITNGNACIEAMGLSGLFEFSLAPGERTLEQKPGRSMFDSAAARLNIANRHLLHIGDCPTSDVQGALNADCMALWYNVKERPLSGKIPHLEIDSMDKLLQLL